MKLQGRNVKPNMRGKDVRLLQTELRQLGFDIPNESGFFDSITFLAVKEFQQLHGLPAIGIVDAKTARAIDAEIAGFPREGYLVTGQAVRADGSSATGVIVAVIEKTLRGERRRGNDQSDGQGQFEVTYQPPEILPFSIFLRVSDASGVELVSSEIICDAGPHEIVNLVVGGEALRGPSEYDQLERVLRSELATEQLNL